MQYEGAAIRQAVVRIRSIQSLKRTVHGSLHHEDSGAKDPGEGKQMDEYLVIQRNIWKGKEQPWMVWGTIQEPDADELLL